MNYKYIEIGTADFSSLIKKYPDDLGLSVEPVKYLLDNLPDKPNNKKLNYAISDENGEKDFYKLKDEYLSDKTKRKYERGMSCLVGGDNEEKRITKSIRFQRFEKIKVKTKTLQKLFEEENVNHVEFLKIDTEGFDLNIMKQLHKTNIRPDKIKFEIEHSSKEDYEEIINLFSSDYSSKLTKNDCYLFRHSDQ